MGGVLTHPPQYLPLKGSRKTLKGQKLHWGLFYQVMLCWSSFVNLTQTRVAGEEGTSVLNCFPSELPVDMSARHLFVGLFGFG